MNTILPDLSFENDSPKYKVVIKAIRDQISEAALKPGDKLPPVRELAWQLGITPGTVARAYTELTDEGALVAEVGRGTFVADRKTGEDKISGTPFLIDPAPHNQSVPSGTVNLLSPHVPNVGQAALIRHLLAEVAQDPPSGVMHYPTRRAARPAREAAAKWLGDPALGPLDPEDVVLTNGGQNAVLMTLQTLLRGRKPCILVEALSYPGFRYAANLLRADIVPIEMDQDGVLPEAVAQAARAHDPQVLFVQPEVHSPTVGFMPKARREALAAVAQEHDIQILEDDCFRLGAFRAPSFRKLAPDRSWYVRSISKSISPALRIGMAVTPPGKGSDLRRTVEYSFFGLSTPLIDLTAKLLTHPQLPEMNAAVRDRINAYVRSAAEILRGHDLHWREDVSFLWLQLPNGWRAGAFVQAAERLGVQLRAAEEFSCRNTLAPHAVRLSINAAIAPPDFEEGLRKLRGLLENPPEDIGF